ncbi:MAG: alpha/beta fold hydrolase [Terriglobales bacterium]
MAESIHSPNAFRPTAGRSGGFRASRREFLKNSAAAMFAAPLLRYGAGHNAHTKESDMDLELNGYRLHYEIYGESGEPLLWLHGWSGSGQDWKYIFKDVPGGFRLIGPDMRGNGSSTGFEGMHSFRQSARDMFALLDHLGIERTKAIGLSGGGVALLHMATQQPDRIDAMVVVSAPPYFPQQARSLQRSFSFASLPPEQQAMMRQRSQGGEKQIEWLVKQSHLMAETYDDVNFTPPLLGTVQARTLLVFGDSDPLYPVKLAFDMKESIPRSSLWIVPKGGHGPIFGPDAPRFAETAIKFLQSE